MKLAAHDPYGVHDIIFEGPAERVQELCSSYEIPTYAFIPVTM